MKVDARGLACPQPVLMTKNALDTDKSVQVLVDNITARNNILRFAQSKGCRVSVSDGETEGEFVIDIEK